MYSSFKNDLDEEVKKAVIQMGVTEKDSLPYFRLASLTLEAAGKDYSEDFKGKTPAEWLEKIKQINRRNLEIAGVIKQQEYAWKEMARQLVESTSVLLKAYDIQGRCLVALCNKLGVSFDSILSEWSAGGERPKVPAYTEKEKVVDKNIVPGQGNDDIVLPF